MQSDQRIGVTTKRHRPSNPNERWGSGPKGWEVNFSGYQRNVGSDMSWLTQLEYEYGGLRYRNLRYGGQQGCEFLPIIGPPSIDDNDPPSIFTTFTSRRVLLNKA